MKNIFLSAIFVGGILPMFLFGFFNYFYKPITEKLSVSSLLFGVTCGGMFIALLYSFFFEDRVLFREITQKEFGWGILAGLFWALAVLCIGIAFKKLNANASQIIPIVNANSLITVLLAIWLLQEQVVVWKVILGTVLIVLGTILLV